MFYQYLKLSWEKLETPGHITLSDWREWALISFFEIGNADGIRTHDIQDENLLA